MRKTERPERLRAGFSSFAGLVKSRFIYDFRPFKQKRMRRFYADYLSERDLGFDIGALTGSRTRAWLSLGVRVVAVEPQPVFYRFLKRKFGRRCTVLRLAVGGTAKQTVMKLSSTNPSVSSFSKEWADLMSSIDPSIRWDGETVVEMVTLDGLIASYGMPSFCKIDVEGFEKEVLQGLSIPLPALSFEFFPAAPEKTGECIDLLEELGGYRYNFSLVESFTYQSKKWLTAEEIKKEITQTGGDCSGDIYAVLSSAAASAPCLG